MLLVDTSVVIKWVHEKGETEVDAARRILTAHRAKTTHVLLLDLVTYEFGNVLLRALRQPAAVVIEQLDLVHRLCGPFLHPAPSWWEQAALLGAQHDLTFYDASWAAAARALDCPLVSSDSELLAAGLAIAPGAAAALL